MTSSVLHARPETGQGIFPQKFKVKIELTEVA